MTRDEVLERLSAERAVFDARVARVPRALLDVPPPGREHSVKAIVAHVTAYEELIVERVRAAERGETTAFSRDREGYEAFNDAVWERVKGTPAEDVLKRAERVFGELLDAVGGLTEDDLAGRSELTERIDPGWLEGRPLWELIGVDAFDHYPMHYEGLDAATPAG